ncbi:MAG: Calx-beta domain-containing protein, partial [Candidatus Eisenbacteria bacterium]
MPGQRIVAVGSAQVNLARLARQEALGQTKRPPVRPRVLPELEEEGEPGAGAVGPVPAPTPPEPLRIQLASPSPDVSFMGLDDIPAVDSSYIYIPPDVDGAVGRTRLFEGLNNNYRVLDKATGTTISTVGTGTFWAPTGATLNALTDPRLVYDPYNDRWIAAMQTFESSADILIGVSQTSDPAGNWFLYRFNTGASIDFPNLGFNRDWIVVAINRYSAGGTFQRGITLVVDYPQARAGTGTGTLFTQAAGTHFCSAPCASYSTTSDTEYVVTHLSSASATYTLDRITGTSSAPVYTAGGTLTRPGGAWVQPSGNLLPQSLPNSGTSACGATPCPIETQDSQIRSAPVFRSGQVWYTQTVGLPSTGLTHTGVQWTHLTTPAGAFVEGGRIEDPTATATNGGLWYVYPHIAVNSTGDFMIGFSRFSSAQHPSAGYAMHLAADGVGTLRDPIVYHAGEDYYHKTFSTTTGRNRWGDFSSAEVDPNDVTLWTVQEYAKTRAGTDDGNTGGNSSRWSTWWAGVGTAAPTVTIDPGPSLAEGNSGTTSFGFTARLSSVSSQPVTVQYQTVDGTATVADNDYQPLNSSITIPAGSTTGPIAVSVVGDTQCETDETFAVTLTSATNGVLGSPVTATGTILNDDSKVIQASAGAGGGISPSGSVGVACFASQGFTITPNTGYHVADVLVDGGSVGPVTTFGFPNVTTDHTIAASFAANLFTLTLTSLGTGSLTKAPDLPSYPYGTAVQLTAAPGTGFEFTGWGGDTTGATNPLSLTMIANRSITGAFA